jgi:hypothetical protein
MRCSFAGWRHAARLPALSLHQSPAHLANVAYCIAGTVNSADKLYRVIDSVRPDTKHACRSTVPIPADGAGGSVMGRHSWLSELHHNWRPPSLSSGVVAVVCANGEKQCLRQRQNRGNCGCFILGLIIAGGALSVVPLWSAFSGQAHFWPEILLATIAAGLVMLGPGAWLIDARLFGRKRLIRER